MCDMVNLVRSGSHCGHSGEEMQTGRWSTESESGILCVDVLLI